MGASTDDRAVGDPLAIALAQARVNAQPLDAAAWPDLGPEAARTTSEELYASLCARGARMIGAKVGAIDREVQEALGTDRPFVGPLHSDVLVASGGELRRGALIAPAIELEIGLLVEAEAAPVPVAAVEIVDSRWGWGVGIDYANADYGCQAAMLFGEPVDGAGPVVEAAARRDGEEVARGSGPVADALARLPLVADLLADDAPQYVATGSLVVPVPLTAGEWEFDFGPLGTLDLTVRP